jgi:hypothetical protein
MAGAVRLYEEMRAEREDGRLPPGAYRLVWGACNRREVRRHA